MTVDMITKIAAEQPQPLMHFRWGLAAVSLVEKASGSSMSRWWAAGARGFTCSFLSDMFNL